MTLGHRLVRALTIISSVKLTSFDMFVLSFEETGTVIAVSPFGRAKINMLGITACSRGLLDRSTSPTSLEVQRNVGHRFLAEMATRIPACKSYVQLISSSLQLQASKDEGILCYCKRIAYQSMCEENSCRVRGTFHERDG